ncbi:molybdenum cofactor guanylyltransferase [Abditibacterium utsteinense]|uniref:Probable molybdenum cofactor guanylyltransferase n=2 Tax=Abditibacterium utsteinense TaxID=1960156 RepID=A0A2S8SW31_9BACT|nr:molybdenum cofactor guanylyltransferase [Abditibacterium utsteinense]
MNNADSAFGEDTTSDLPAIAILAGGKSRRMGRDKAQLEWNGVSWLEHTARVALDATPNVAIIGRNRPQLWPLKNVVFLEDAVSGAGPLGGVLAALRWAKNTKKNSVLALACDMPKLSVEAVSWIFKVAAQQRLQHGLAVRNDGRIEPLFSIYTTDCLALIGQRLACIETSPARFSLQSLIESGDFELVNAPFHIAARLLNLNTPQDLKVLTEK